MIDSHLPACFVDRHYLIVRSLLDEPMLSIVGNYALRRAGSGTMSMNDKQAPDTPSAYGDPMMETLLSELQPELERCTGSQLYPTYAFFRV